jgi:predicted secreted protein
LELLAVSLTTAIAIYFVLWWVVLFAVLPWGVRSQEESGAVAPGTDPGAPTLPMLWRKLVWTTIATGVIFAVGVALYRYDIVTFDKLANWLGVS